MELRSTYRSFSFSSLTLITLVVFALISGLALSVGTWPLAVAITAVVYLVLAYAMLLKSTHYGLRDGFFWVMFGLVFILALVHKITGYSAYFVLEVILIAASPFLFATLYRVTKESQFFRMWFFVFAFFLLWTIIASLTGRSHAVPAVYQFLSNLKIIFVLLLGFYLAWSSRTEIYFWAVIRWFWLPMLVLVGWQWGDPSTYFSLFGKADPGTDDPLKLFPSRALGPFQHPSFLGTYAALFMMFSIGRAALRGEKRYVFISFCYLLLLIASTQRQETAAAILVMLVVAILLLGRRNILVSVLFSGIVGLSVAIGAWALIKDNLVREAEAWGIIGYVPIENPRQVLYINAIQIANEYSPFGSGLGTFGSAGARKFDTSLYVERGFGSYWWFEKEDFLMDTYWPGVIAETGWPGFLLLLALFLALILYAASEFTRKYPQRTRELWMMAFGGMLFTFIVSFTSPAYQDPGLFLLCGVFLGIAYNQTISRKPTLDSQ